MFHMGSTSLLPPRRGSLVCTTYSQMDFEPVQGMTPLGSSGSLDEADLDPLNPTSVTFLHVPLASSFHSENGRQPRSIPPASAAKWVIDFQLEMIQRGKSLRGSDYCGLNKLPF